MRELHELNELLFSNTDWTDSHGCFFLPRLSGLNRFIQDHVIGLPFAVRELHELNELIILPRLSGLNGFISDCVIGLPLAVWSCNLLILTNGDWTDGHGF